MLYLCASDVAPSFQFDPNTLLAQTPTGPSKIFLLQGGDVSPPSFCVFLHITLGVDEAFLLFRCPRPLSLP